MGNTTNLPEVRINRGLTLDNVSEVLDAIHGKGALRLLILLVWRRQYDGDDWITVTNSEWKKRANKDRKEKYRAGQALEKLGLVVISSSGKRSLQYKLAPSVDPRTIRNKAPKKEGMFSQSENIVNLADLPDPVIVISDASDKIVTSLKNSEPKYW